MLIVSLEAFKTQSNLFGGTIVANQRNKPAHFQRNQSNAHRKQSKNFSSSNQSNYSISESRDIYSRESESSMAEVLYT
jgi:hypothetical protein